MQQRHLDRQAYFNELANTSRDYYIDYLRKFIPIEKGSRVLEIGCGDGGNLLPFAEIGCHITGIDRSETRISQATSFFLSTNHTGNFIDIDFFEMKASDEEDKYDIILIHDVIEHIEKKDSFIKHVRNFIADDGVIFWGFPAWQMPFGGHQQICRNKLCSMLPFIHLLPECIYHTILKMFGEKKSCIDELIDIKRCKISIEKFEELMRDNNLRIADRCLWFINPHYKQKFNLKPRKLYGFISHIRYVRNYFSTSCFYITDMSKIDNGQWTINN